MQYIEDIALYWEEQGLPRIAGRIVGLLLVCDPPTRTATQLATQLGVSKGSISSMTRLLLQSGSIEVVAKPGARATHYQLVTHSLERKMALRLGKFVAFRELAERGLELLADAPKKRSERLEETAGIYEFMAREIPLLLERYRKERDQSDD